MKVSFNYPFNLLEAKKSSTGYEGEAARDYGKEDLSVTRLLYSDCYCIHMRDQVFVSEL